MRSRRRRPRIAAPAADTGGSNSGTRRKDPCGWSDEENLYRRYGPQLALRRVDNGRELAYSLRKATARRCCINKEPSCPDSHRRSPPQRNWLRRLRNGSWRLASARRGHRSWLLPSKGSYAVGAKPEARAPRTFPFVAFANQSDH